MLGFRMKETMTGTHEFNSGFGAPGKKFMEFVINWGPENIKKWINPFSSYFLSQRLSGKITIEDLCENQKCWGVLKLQYWKGRLEYNIFFSLNGTLYEYIGIKKDIKPWNLHRTHTTCYGTLRNLYTGNIISKSTTYFELKTLPSFLGSFRLTKPQ
jgi:hypothetical protein